jgi:hypothetical protein
MVYDEQLHAMEMTDIHLKVSRVIMTYVYHFVGFVMVIATVKVSFCFMNN